MESTKYLLIGGGLASSRAADQIRKHDPDGSILLVSDEAHPPYDRPPLSKEFLRRERGPEALLYHTAEDLASRKIDLRLETRIEALDTSRHVASTDDGQHIQFDRALIATGGRPVRLGLPGEDLPGVHYLRTLEDARAIAAAAEQPGDVVIIGAGFIGLEAAASLTQLGMRVTVIEMAPRVWPRFADPAVSAYFERHCSARGVTFVTNEVAASIRGPDRARSVVTESGDEYAGDVVLVSAGIVPNIELAQAADLVTDDGIVVDGDMRTSAEGVFAAGDIVNYPDPVFGRRRVEHWGHAEHSGQVAGINMAGGAQQYTMMSYVWSDVFDLHLEFAGDETRHDRTLMRGDLDGGSFIQLCLQDQHLTAYFSVNGPKKEFLPLQKLMRQRVDLTGKEAALRDPEYRIRELL